MEYYGNTASHRKDKEVIIEELIFVLSFEE